MWKFDVIPANLLSLSKEKYLYLIRKYGSGVINSGTNLIISYYEKN